MMSQGTRSSTRRVTGYWSAPGGPGRPGAAMTSSAQTIGRAKSSHEPDQLRGSDPMRWRVCRSPGARFEPSAACRSRRRRGDRRWVLGRGRRHSPCGPPWPPTDRGRDRSRHQREGARRGRGHDHGALGAGGHRRRGRPLRSALARAVDGAARGSRHRRSQNFFIGPAAWHIIGIPPAPC